MGFVFKLNSHGVREVLMSGEVEGVLYDKAVEIAARAQSAAAGLTYDGQPVEIKVVRGTRERTRARVSVWIDSPGGTAIESRDRILGSSI